MAAGRRPVWIALGLAALALAADQATKAAVRATIGLGESVPAVGPFSIHHVRNSGLLGGHLQGSALPIAVVTSIALAGLVVYVLRRRHGGLLSAAGFGLLLGGGLGNLVDRLRLGYVTDFLDRGADGAFNVADVSVALGLLAIVAAHLRRPAASSRLQPRPDARAGD